MERRYFYARAVGNPQFTLNDIVSAVENAGLASKIPLVKLERKARREFYVFLAVDDEETEGIPGELGNILRTRGIRFDEDYPLRPADIKSMVQRQDIEIHGFSALKYRRIKFQDPGDPFESSDAWNPREALPETSAYYDRLLHWLSAYGEGSWEVFLRACKALKVANTNSEARSALRRLTLLGHIEPSADGSRWAASAPCLVRFANDSNCGFLSGQRTSKFLERIRDCWSLQESPQSHFSGPAQVVVDPRICDIPKGGVELGVVDAGITSIRLAELLPDLSRWKDSLLSISNLDIMPFDVERWSEGGFQLCNTMYNRDGIYYGERGMYRLRRKADTSGRTMTLYFDEPAQRWLRGDWYGLRFLSIRLGEDEVECVYSSQAEELLILESQRWPLLYEKTLTLASGLLPGRAANPNWLSYPCIPLSLARTLCEKLSLILIEE